MSGRKQLTKQPGIKSVTLRSPGKNKKELLPKEQETNIDFAYGLARQMSAERKKMQKKGANAANAANNIRLEYHDVVLGANNNNNKNKKKSSNTKKKPKPKQHNKSHDITMDFFNSD